MVNIDRRRFLQLAGGATALTMLDQSIARAASIPLPRSRPMVGSAIDRSVLSTISTKKARQRAARGIHAARRDG